MEKVSVAIVILKVRKTYKGYIFKTIQSYSHTLVGLSNNYCLGIIKVHGMLCWEDKGFYKM